MSKKKTTVDNSLFDAICLSESFTMETDTEEMADIHLTAETWKSDHKNPMLVPVRRTEQDCLMEFGARQELISIFPGKHPISPLTVGHYQGCTVQWCDWWKQLWGHRKKLNLAKWKKAPLCEVWEHIHNDWVRKMFPSYNLPVYAELANRRFNPYAYYVWRPPRVLTVPVSFKVPASKAWQLHRLDETWNPWVFLHFVKR